MSIIICRLREHRLRPGCQLGELHGHPDRHIEYEPDGPYVDAGAGENHRLSADYDVYLRRYQTLRSFPSGVRNCYALPTVAGTKYLLRAEFEYGNYDGKNSSSLEFDLHLGANRWRTAKLPEFKDEHDVIFVAWAGWAPFCLVNTGRGTPFVNVVELRPLVGSALLYPQAAPRPLLDHVQTAKHGDKQFHTVC